MIIVNLYANKYDTYTKVLHTFPAAVAPVTSPRCAVTVISALFASTVSVYRDASLTLELDAPNARVLGLAVGGLEDVSVCVKACGKEPIPAGKSWES